MLRYFVLFVALLVTFFACAIVYPQYRETEVLASVSAQAFAIHLSMVVLLVFLALVTYLIVPRRGDKPDGVHRFVLVALVLFGGMTMLTPSTVGLNGLNQVIGSLAGVQQFALSFFGWTISPAASVPGLQENTLYLSDFLPNQIAGAAMIVGAAPIVDAVDQSADDITKALKTQIEEQNKILRVVVDPANLAAWQRMEFELGGSVYGPHLKPLEVNCSVRDLRAPPVERITESADERCLRMLILSRRSYLEDQLVDLKQDDIDWADEILFVTDRNSDPVWVSAREYKSNKASYNRRHGARRSLQELAEAATLNPSGAHTVPSWPILSQDDSLLFAVRKAAETNIVSDHLLVMGNRQNKSGTSSEFGIYSLNFRQAMLAFGDSNT